MRPPTVFLSYTGADNTAAQRIYDDLKRSGYDVWSFEADARLGVNYETEYREQLLQRNYFILLDSPRARQSPHVKTECELAWGRQQKEPDFGILPCLIVEPSPNWFESDDLFPDQTKLQFVNVARDHNAGMTRLCRHMGDRNYFPVSDLPEDEEFFSELSNRGAVSREMFQSLSQVYQEFREECGSSPEQALTSIHLIINRLDRAGVNGIATPWVALGVLESEHGNYPAAVEAFTTATRNRPDYDRAWCARAASHMALGNYQEALDAYLQCRRLLTPGHRNLDNLPMVLFGIAIARFRLGDTLGAAATLDHNQDEIEGHGHALRAQIHLQENRSDLALHALEKACSYFEARQAAVPLDVFLTLANIHRSQGQYDRERQVIEQAVRQFEEDPEALRSIVDQMIDESVDLPLEFLRMTVKINPSSFVYRAELASVNYVLGDISTARRDAEPCLFLEDELNRRMSPRERYYQGLAFHILGKSELAEHALQRARRLDQLLASWPTYPQLLNRRSSRS